MAQSNIKVLALDLDGTLTNDRKEITPRTRAALDAALARGVTVVLASGRPIAGVTPVARALDLGQPGRAGAILAYNGGAIVDCGPGHRVLWQQVLPAPMVPALCRFAAEQNVAIVTYNEEGVVTERPGDPWAQREGFTNKLPMIEVADLAAYVNYPVNKMLITLDPVRLPHVLRAGAERFAGQIDLYPSSPFFIEAVPLGVAKDKSLAALLDRMGFTRENLMACGDGMNDRSMLRYAGVGVAMANAEGPVKAEADYITDADNNHDGVAEAVERFILH
ncbi:MAG TPA: Cof-type HAD-IIB family hydrolase [Candidatus Faecalibacterium faecipullorum]|uniref:Cof-type HAD-IIB family hydrolase n=1 Tax=Candidatus Faecalibacterium faecipullorum TaxID=2838578 RepID=A0A9D2MEG1_9FIRM|nr:Cof-type HAD-IIB family hydrolase [Candidatus Faecalibacterium faecipullorum]